jgi:hypothetical protein
MKKFTAVWLALCAGVLGYGLGKHSTEERCFALIDQIQHHESR